MEDFLIGVVILVILGCAIYYIAQSKKKGVKCIGCPSSHQCSSGKCCCGHDSKK